MERFNLLKRGAGNEVRCALCLAKAPKRTSIELYEKSVCDWCVRYYSAAFPNDWKDRVGGLLLL
jgi:hypothetical protein